jgi:23S rRNA (guanosine2251-2'-O)-methyltransferase
VILYGRNPVREALRGRRAHSVSGVWATAGAAREPWLQGVRVKVCAAEELERRCGSSAHQGVCADAGGYPYVGSEELLATDAPLIVALDQVQDPQNLGSICRTAECAGTTGVVIPERRSAEVTPAVCKASAGAVEHLRIAKVRNVADFLGEARDAGCWCFGASAPAGDSPVSEGKRSAGRHKLRDDIPGERRLGAAGQGLQRASSGPSTVPYTAPDYSGGVVLVLGSEGSGLRPRVASACDQLVSLPLRGRMGSLGVAAAAAALLYGILQDREKMLDKAP